MGSFADFAGGGSTATAPSAPTQPSPMRSFADFASNVETAAANDPRTAPLIALKRHVAPKIMDLLDRQRQTTHAAIAGHNPLDALLHGRSPEQQDQDRAMMRQKIGMPGAEDRAQLGGFRGGFDDFLTDTLLDPLSFETAGIGALGRLVGGAARATGNVAKQVAPGLARDLGEAGHLVSDRMTYGGSAKRTLGDETYHRALAADNTRAARAAEAARRLAERFAPIKALPDDERFAVYQVLNGERDTRGMPQHLVDAVKTARALTLDAAQLRANESGARKIAYGGGRLAQADVKFRMGGPKPFVDDGYGGTLSQLMAAAQERSTHGPGGRGFTGRNAIAMTHADDVKPDNVRHLVGRVERTRELPAGLREFAAPVEQGTLGAENVRASYLPAPRAKGAVGDRDAFTVNDLMPRDRNLPTREQFVVDPKQLAEHDEAFDSMLRGAAEQGASGRMREQLGVKIGGDANPALVDLFEHTVPAAGARRGVAQRLDERWRGFVNIPKNVVTTLGLKHGLVNVPALAAQSEGAGAAAEGLAGGAHALAMTPEQRWERFRPGVEGGVVTPFEDRQNPIVGALEKLPGPLGKLIGGGSRKANDLTWAIDDAAKQAVFVRKKAKFVRDGMSEEAATTKAAAETMRDMIDYRHRSDFTKALGLVAPFATFRSRLPAAGGAIARNPARLMRYDRATSGLWGSGATGVGEPGETKPHRLSMTTPIADELELPFEPWRYGRATLADPAKAGLTAPFEMAQALGALDPVRDKKTIDFLHYLTYGQPLLPHRKRKGGWGAGFIGSSAASDVPYGLGQYGLGAAGLSEFPATSPLELLLGPTIGAHVR